MVVVVVVVFLVEVVVDVVVDVVVPQDSMFSNSLSRQELKGNTFEYKYDK